MITLGGGAEESICEVFLGSSLIHKGAQFVKFHQAVPLRLVHFSVCILFFNTVP